MKSLNYRMHKYIILFFSVSLFLFACGKNKEPSGVINPNVMVGLLTEVHIVDGRLYTLSQTPDSLRKYGAKKYLSLFKKYGTDSLQFRKSLQYYSTQPEELLIIYDKVLAKLKLKTDSLNALQNKINAASK